MFKSISIISTILLSFIISNSNDARAEVAAPPSPIITTAPWNGKIYDTKAKKIISREELVQELLKRQIIVLGEKHYSPETHLAEAAVIEQVMKAQPPQKPLSTAWEFLFASRQAEINKTYQKFAEREISVSQLLKDIHSKPQSDLYAPLFLTTRKHGGKILGVNLSYEEKKPIKDGGLEALDPGLIPPGFELGSDTYFKRFEESMAGHGTPEQVTNFYASQCLTDDVMAFRLGEAINDDIRFLITGAFHMEYGEGVIARLKKRQGDGAIATIRVLDVNDYVESELYEFIHHPQYGAISDFVIFVREPFEVIF